VGVCKITLLKNVIVAMGRVSWGLPNNVHGGGGGGGVDSGGGSGSGGCCSNRSSCSGSGDSEDFKLIGLVYLISLSLHFSSIKRPPFGKKNMQNDS